MPSDLNAPGLKLRRRKNGPDTLYWVARNDLVKAGYRPETIRLRHSLDEPDHLPLISAACMRYQAEMLEWAVGRRDDRKRFDGTIAGLVRCYQVDGASPYHGQKWNTRRTNNHLLKLIEKAFGERVLGALHIGDFRRWYDAAKKPNAAGGPERVDRACKIIKMLRELFKYGVTAELPECQRLRTILMEAEFRQARRRKTKLELEHVEAFVANALEVGKVSLALGTALQFETMLRQKDVIGEWEPILAGTAASGIVLNGRRWVNGLVWSDLGEGLQLVKDTTKTGQTAAHDLTLCPIVMRVLAHVPANRRIGPLIIDPASGRPYAEFVYTREWRRIANAAGIPKHVWNMDARAGGISEADDAGAELDHIRSAAAHAQATTTARYVRGTRGKSRKVAELRLAHRATRNKP
ncbi:hypothetical protein OPKNFCMD_3562 [Methylobacterium crusticola]|uniref:Integrase n=1 Tax=Methylobacterium crusticola TaxID=1697972 RepID=A0ABQ4R0J2_9HYPH|nr:integrase [Methylobacterium crusticola]GJD50816.1 hypothetical protein OPKNFCMD_3562 [Methylobacterium crusticola]